MGRTYTEIELKDHKRVLDKSLRLMESWLSESRYLCGDKLTIADISAVCEIAQKEFIFLDI